MLSLLFCNFVSSRAEFTKSIAKPALGESGVAFSMVVYGAFNAIVSIASVQVRFCNDF